MLKEIWSYLSNYRKKQFYLLIALMVVSSMLDVVSIGLVLPFLGLLTAPEQVFYHSLMQPLIGILGLSDPKQLILPITILFISAAIIASVLRLLLLYVITRFSFEVGTDLSIDIYRRTLYQEYLVHIKRNSSEVINGIITKTNMVINGRLIPILTLISAAILLVNILVLLFLVNIKLTLLSLIIFGSIYGIIIRYTKIKLKNNSRSIADQSTKMLKSLQEGLGGIRDVLINRSQEFYCNLYRNSDIPMRKALGSNQFISGSPRHLLDALGMVLIASIAYYMTQIGGDGMSAIPTLGVLAFGAQRMLPALQLSYAAYSTIKGTQSSVIDVVNLLEQKLPEHSYNKERHRKPFMKEIWLNDVGFKYSKESPWILKNINLKIEKGSRIGFVGETGSGKSTLLDIVMGLLPPTKGKLIIDGQIIDTENVIGWRSNIAHVPQNIYLSDSTVEENIAFGVPKDKIDHRIIKKAAEQAQIAKVIEGWENGYQTLVGEQGINLSGGQRQRIGIARALYKQVSVLILDEATSALDHQTETALMRVIKGLEKNLTVLIIAHRTTTLNGCDKIINLNNDGTIQVKHSS